MVPANCTDLLQPMDISVNKPAKNFLRGQFQDWYATQICQQLKVVGEVQTQAVQPVDLRLSIMKPLGARWMVMTTLSPSQKSSKMASKVLESWIFSTKFRL